MKNPAATIERAGRILFGEHWKHAFAETFDVSYRAVSRMAKDEQPVPDGLMAELETALHDHGHALDELLEEFVDRE